MYYSRHGSHLRALASLGIRESNGGLPQPKYSLALSYFGKLQSITRKETKLSNSKHD